MARNSQIVRAFTLIELLVVIAVIAILITIAYPVYTGMLERGKATKEMSNLRQIGVATQAYLSDSDGVFFSPTAGTWTSQLNPKYVASWAIFQSPFDKRASSENGTTAPVSPISYGVNANIDPAGGIAVSVTKITKPTAFILFAPAQDSFATVRFAGLATSAIPGVTVKGIGSNKATSVPGGDAVGGTHSSRQRISALFADLHCETMSWATFTNNAPNANDPDGAFRWNP